MSKTNTDFVDKVAWIFIKDNKILSTRSKGRDVFFIPGGKREQGESDIECMQREILEELNVQIKVETVRFFGTYESKSYGDKLGRDVKMECYFADFDGTLSASREIEEFAWLSYEDKSRSSYVDKIIFDALVEKKYLSPNKDVEKV